MKLQSLNRLLIRLENVNFNTKNEFKSDFKSRCSSCSWFGPNSPHLSSHSNTQASSHHFTDMLTYESLHFCWTAFAHVSFIPPLPPAPSRSKQLDFDDPPKEREGKGAQDSTWGNSLADDCKVVGWVSCARRGRHTLCLRVLCVRRLQRPPTLCCIILSWCSTHWCIASQTPMLSRATCSQVLFENKTGICCSPKWTYGTGYILMCLDQ